MLCNSRCLQTEHRRCSRLSGRPCRSVAHAKQIMEPLERVMGRGCTQGGLCRPHRSQGSYWTSERVIPSIIAAARAHEGTSSLVIRIFSTHVVFDLTHRSLDVSGHLDMPGDEVPTAPDGTEYLRGSSDGRPVQRVGQGDYHVRDRNA